MQHPTLFLISCSVTLTNTEQTESFPLSDQRLRLDAGDMTEVTIEPDLQKTGVPQKAQRSIHSLCRQYHIRHLLNYSLTDVFEDPHKQQTGGPLP